MPEKLIILTGEIGTGKTSRLLLWARGRNDIHGIVTPVQEGTRYFADIYSGEQFRMEADFEEASLYVGKYRFSSSAFKRAAAIVAGYVQSDGWLVIDEIGPMELSGQGFAEILEKVLAERRGNTLLVVRKPIVEDVINFFSLRQFPLQIINVGDTMQF